MTVLMLWAFYPAGLTWFYSQDPTLAGKSFAEQQQALLQSRMLGWMANMSLLMNCMGIKTEFIVTNAEPMQKQWAREHHVTYSADQWQLEIALAQIRHFKPEILWIAFLVAMLGSFMREARRGVRKVVMWCGSPFTETADVDGVDVLLTENPMTLHAVQKRFEKVIVAKPGFDGSLLHELGSPSKMQDVTFCGQLSPMHGRRRALLAKLLRSGVDVDLFAMMTDVDERSTVDAIKAAGWAFVRARRPKAAFEHLRSAMIPGPETRDWRTILPCVKPPVFGLEMYRILAASRVTLNIHIDVADRNAGNMRMFEATGVGSCLVTEWTENIGDLFEPGIEIATYRTDEDFVDIVRELVAHPQKAEDIGRAGQKRVLRDHTLERMWGDIVQAFA
jgi:spore maturation protein CgeB